MGNLAVLGMQGWEAVNDGVDDSASSDTQEAGSVDVAGSAKESSAAQPGQAVSGQQPQGKPPHRKVAMSNMVVEIIFLFCNIAAFFACPSSGWHSCSCAGQCAEHRCHGCIWCHTCEKERQRQLKKEESMYKE